MILFICDRSGGAAGYIRPDYLLNETMYAVIRENDITIASLNWKRASKERFGACDFFLFETR